MVKAKKMIFCFSGTILEKTNAKGGGAKIFIALDLKKQNKIKFD